jgi:tetratricopeptide (TPR) repeat protein
LSRAEPDVKIAIENARNAVLASPRSGAAWGELGEFLEAHSFHQEAQLCLAQAMQFDKGKFLWPYLRGDILNTRNPATAEQCFQQAARVRPQLALPRVRLAELFLEQRRLEQAQQEYEAAIRLEPENARALFGLGQVAFSRGDFAEARRWAEQSFALDGEHRRTAALLLRLAHRSGDQTAIDRQQAILDAMPAREVDWEDPFTEIVKQKRRDRAGLATLATEALESGRLAEAAAAFDWLAHGDPDNVQWHALLAITLCKQREFSRAALVLETALARHSQVADLHFQRGVVHFHVQEWAGAADEFRRAIELKPDFRDARYNLAQTQIKLGDHETALATLREAVRVRPNDAVAFAVLGKLLLDRGDRDAARDALETAARLAPQDAAIRQSLEDLRNNTGKNDSVKDGGTK